MGRCLRKTRDLLKTCCRTHIRMQCMKVLVILKTHTCNEFLEPHGRQDMPCFVYEHSNTFARISPLHFLKAATARLREDLP